MAKKPRSTVPDDPAAQQDVASTTKRNSRSKSMDIHTLLRNSVNLGASDLHVAAGYSPMIRIDGSLKRMDAPALTGTQARQMFRSIMTDEQYDLYERESEIDYAYEMPKVGRFRCNIYHQMNGESGAFRVIPQKIMTLEDMQAPEGVFNLAREKSGLILVTGPTGSGKSTTLAAIINLINREKKDHILTIEDPIEYVHTGINCLINQREVGDHSQSFSRALKSALREDPDVILVGEMRDLETIALAVTAAETGHLVLATLHTSSAPESVDRVIDVFPPEQQHQIRAVFSNSLKGVISQKLLPKKSGKGRSAVMEIMIATSAIRNLIREAKTHQMSTAIQTNQDQGMQTFDQALLGRVNEEVIDVSIALEHAIEKQPFERWKGETRNILQHVNI